MDEGQATPEDYTVLIAEPPPLLGVAGPNAAVRAIEAYTAFFAELCQRGAEEPAAEPAASEPAASRRGAPTRSRDDFVPVDGSISEIVIIKASDYLDFRKRLRTQHEAIHGAVAREQWYVSEGGTDTKYRQRLHEHTLKVREPKRQ